MQQVNIVNLNKNIIKVIRFPALKGLSSKEGNEVALKRDLEKQWRDYRRSSERSAVILVRPGRDRQGFRTHRLAITLFNESVLVRVRLLGSVLIYILVDHRAVAAESKSRITSIRFSSSEFDPGQRASRDSGHVALPEQGSRFLRRPIR